MKSGNLDIRSPRYEEFFNGVPDRMWLTFYNPDPVNSYTIDLFGIDKSLGTTQQSYSYGIIFSHGSVDTSVVSIVVNGVSYNISTASLNGPQITAAINALIGPSGSLAQFEQWTYIPTLINGFPGAYLMVSSGVNVFGNMTTDFVDFPFSGSSTFGPIAGPTFLGTPIVVTGSQSYNELNRMQLGGAYKINRMWLQGSSSQILQPIQIQYKTIDGNIEQQTLHYEFDPYQKNNISITPTTFKSFILNTDTLISQYTILPSAAFQIFFDYTKGVPFDFQTVESPDNENSLPVGLTTANLVPERRLNPKSKHWLELFEKETNF